MNPFAPIAPPRRSIVELIHDGVLDAELAALAWLLVEARVPVVVAASAWRIGRTTTLEALLDFLVPTTNRIDLRGERESFDWLPEADTLGWRDDDPVEPTELPTHRAAAPAAPAPASTIGPATGYLVATEFGDQLPGGTWGERARIAVRAASIGYGLGATIRADRLEEVFAALESDLAGGPGLVRDELSWLGLVIVLRAVALPDGTPARRVVAAHYVRPVARDLHGHVQRLGPAVLATWDRATDRLEHFAWGVIPELALRVGRRPGDFEIEQDRRAAHLRGLVAAGRTARGEALAGLAAYEPADRPSR